jgi:hypothetical protein
MYLDRSFPIRNLDTRLNLRGFCESLRPRLGSTRGAAGAKFGPAMRLAMRSRSGRRLILWPQGQGRGGVGSSRDVPRGSMAGEAREELELVTGSWGGPRSRGRGVWPVRVASATSQRDRSSKTARRRGAKGPGAGKRLVTYLVYGASERMRTGKETSEPRVAGLARPGRAGTGSDS